MNDELTGAGEALLRSFMGTVGRQPAGYLHLLSALDFNLGPHSEATIIGGTEAERAAILRSLGRRFIPGLVIRSVQAAEPLSVHLCAAGACRPPVHDVAGLEVLLDGLGE
jgi:hypothetical protein